MDVLKVSAKSSPNSVAGALPEYYGKEEELNCRQ